MTEIAYCFEPIRCIHRQSSLTNITISRYTAATALERIGSTSMWMKSVQSIKWLKACLLGRPVYMRVTIAMQNNDISVDIVVIQMNRVWHVSNTHDHTRPRLVQSTYLSLTFFLTLTLSLSRSSVDDWSSFRWHCRSIKRLADGWSRARERERERQRQTETGLNSSRSFSHVGLMQSMTSRSG